MSSSGSESDHGGDDNAGQPSTKRLKLDPVSQLLKKTDSGYKLKLKTTVASGKQSSVWSKFQLVYDDKDCHSGYVQCTHCKKLMTYSGTTSHLSRHTCEAAKQGSSLSAYFPSKDKRPNTFAKNAVKNACVKMCARDLRPFSIVEGNGFAEVAQALISVGSTIGNIDARDVLPHHTTISYVTAEQAAECRIKLKEILATTLFDIGGGVTFDIWTDSVKNNSYICFTAHFMDDSWNLKEFVLANRYFEADLPKTSEKILRKLREVLTQYGGEFEKARTSIIFITDRGSNVLGALKGMGSMPCGAHILNNVLSTLFDPSKGHIPNEFIKCINDAKAIVTYFKRAGIMSKLKVSLKQECETRWNSKLEMISSVAQRLSSIDQILLERRQQDRSYTIDADIMQDLVHFLQPFKDMSDKFEANSGPTLHLVLPAYHKLKNHLDVQVEDIAVIALMKDAALKLLKEKFVINKLHRIAAFLNPKMKSLKMLTPEDRAKTLTELRELMSALPDEDISTVLTVAFDTAGPSRSSEPFAKFEDSDNEEAATNAEDQVELYLKMKADKDTPILEFWKANAPTLPKLAKVARRLLSIPASSAPSERNFSNAGRTVEKRRTSINPSKVDDVLFLNSFWKSYSV